MQTSLLQSLRPRLALAALFLAFSVTLAPHAQTPTTDETIVLIRHGEKPMPVAFGQINCMGLNRALALPDVLKPYGKPLAIYAPDPSMKVKDGNNAPDAPTYSYQRPLATIEPYAILIGMPVNAQIGYKELDKLQADILQPAYAHGMVLIAWEHLQAVLFARQLLAAFGDTTTVVPKWLNSDYDTIYVFHITSDDAGKKHITFKIENEGLAGRLPETCPTVTLSPAK